MNSKFFIIGGVVMLLLFGLMMNTNAAVVITEGLFVSKSGDNMTGNLNMVSGANITQGNLTIEWNGTETIIWI